MLTEYAIMQAKALIFLATSVALTMGSAVAASDEMAGLGESERPFTAKIVGPNPEVLIYGDPIVLTAMITPRKNFVRSDFSIRPIGVLAELYDAEETTCIVTGTSKAIANVAQVATCQIPSLPGHRFWKPETWFLPPGTQHFAFEIPIVDTSDNSPIPYFEEVSISFKPPLDAIFMGGLSGALLLALFLTIKDRAEAPAPKIDLEDWASVLTILRSISSWLIELPGRIWKLFLQTIMGGICAIILILIAQTTDGITPPVSIKIQDFWGGLIVGLLSMPMSQWILAQIKPTTGPSPIVPSGQMSALKQP